MLDKLNGTFDPEHSSAVTLERRRLGLTAPGRFDIFYLLTQLKRFNRALCKAKSH